MLALSFILDRYPDLRAPATPVETIAVIGLVGLTILDFVVLKNSIFVVVALISFSSFK